MPCSRARTLTSVAALVLGFSAVAFADPVDIKLPAQPLSAALREFARQTGIQVAIQSELTDGKMSPGLNGKYEPADALAALLKGTGLTAYPVNQNTYGIREAGGTAAKNDKLHTSRNEPSNQRPGLEQTNSADSPNSQAEGPNTSSPANEGEKDTIKTEQIVVTGSRLRTGKTASPLIVITAEDIKQQGFNTPEDVIRSLPQNFSSFNAATVVNQQGQQGQSTADLRGLGPENTLILVDGRRRAASATFYDGTVNLNTIPMAAIERIEIMTDGASAIYGSDAIAGVINFIMKKDYQGGETSVRREVGANGGNASTVSQTLGETWSTGNIIVGARYARNGAVNLHRAGFTTANLTSLGGSDFRTPLYGQPGVSLVTGGSLPAMDDGTHGIAGNLSPDNYVPFDPGLYAQYTSGTAEGRTFSIDVNGEQRLGAHVRTYAELTYADDRSSALGGLTNVGPIDVPATNRFNDTGDTVPAVSYVFANEFLRGLIPAPINVSNQKAYSGTLGFKFDLPVNDWTADISVGRSKEKSFNTGTAVDQTLLTARVNGVDALGNPVPAAQQLNLFGNGTAQNPAALAGLMVPMAPITEYSTLDSGLASAEGSLMKLPGGAMRLAVGLEIRKEVEDYPSVGTLDLLTHEPARTVKAGFAEATLPIVGDHNQIPGIHSLDVFAAARREQYSINGPLDGPTNPTREVIFNHTSPKYGISWYVLPELKLRATVSDSFRAPNLSELFQATSPYFGQGGGIPIVDPLHPEDGAFFPPFMYMGNPTLQPELSHNFTAGFDWSPTDRLQGLSVAMTYDKIDFTNRIENVSEFVYSQTSLLFDFPGVVQRGPDGRITQINVIPINVASRKSENVDLTTTYNFDTRAGHITLGFTGTYAIRLQDVLVPGAAPTREDGTQLGPERQKWRTWIGWSASKCGVNLYVNHSGSYTNTNLGGTPNDQGAAIGPQTVSGYTTYDLTGTYRLDRLGLSFNGGVRDFTNAKFPFFNGAQGPWDAGRVDLRGRVIYLEITKKYGLPGLR